MAIDFEGLKDSVVAGIHQGVEKAKELANTGAVKAKELSEAKEFSEVNKLKVSNSVEQDAIRKAYTELGKLYFAENGSDPAEPYADLCRQITDSLAKIAYNNERIADIKAAGAAASDTAPEEAPVEEAAAEPAAEPETEEIPVEVTTSEDAPAEEAPVEEAPAEEAPAAEAPEAPAEESEAPAEEPKPEE